MAKVTNQQALIAFFNHQDPLVVRNPNARSSKYVVYTSQDTGMNYYIGKMGAVRKGRTVAGSIPLSESRRKLFIAEGKKLIEEAKG